MTKMIFIHGCHSLCPYDNRDDDWLCEHRNTTSTGIPEKCQLQDAPKAEKKEVAISCAAGPPCCYLTFGNFYGCNFNGDCEFQRPRIPKG